MIIDTFALIISRESPIDSPITIEDTLLIKAFIELADAEI